MFRAVIGHSDEIDTEEAIAAVIADCDEQLGADPPHAGLVFSATEYDHQSVLNQIVDRYPNIQLIGCTTDGEMSSRSGFTEDAITLILFRSDEVRFAAGQGAQAGTQPQQAAAAAVAMATSALGESPKLALVLPDGLTASAFEVLEGFRLALGDEVPVIGGMSADRVGGSKHDYATYQFCGREVLSDAVATLMISGELKFSLGVESGWQPIGKRMTVTRAEGNLLYELDNRPAFELYAHYLGDIMYENLAGIGLYPLAICEQGTDRYYLRVANHADPATGTVTFLGEIPIGAQVQITQAIRDSIIGAVEKSAAQAATSYPGQAPAVAMMFSCTGRKIALGTKTEMEISRACQGLPFDIPACGFYTFGEIGPVSDRTRARYHNTTFLTLLLGTG